MTMSTRHYILTSAINDESLTIDFEALKITTSIFLVSVLKLAARAITKLPSSRQINSCFIFVFCARDCSVDLHSHLDLNAREGLETRLTLALGDKSMAAEAFGFLYKPIKNKHDFLT